VGHMDIEVYVVPGRDRELLAGRLVQPNHVHLMSKRGRHPSIGVLYLSPPEKGEPPAPRVVMIPAPSMRHTVPCMQHQVIHGPIILGASPRSCVGRAAAGGGGGERVRTRQSSPALLKPHPDDPQTPSPPTPHQGDERLMMMMILVMTMNVALPPLDPPFPLNPPRRHSPRDGHDGAVEGLGQGHRSSSSALPSSLSSPGTPPPPPPSSSSSSSSSSSLPPTWTTSSGSGIGSWSELCTSAYLVTIGREYTVKLSPSSA
jgi:hypothetical protein